MATLTNSRPPRVMVDTTVLLAGIVWPRWPYEVLQHALRGDLQLVLCQTVLDEARRKFKEKFADWTPEFEAFLEACDYQAAQEPSSEEMLANRDLMRDVTDVPIALAAINAGVDYLVSEDKDFTAEDQTTAQLHQRLNVLLSGTFLRQVMGWTSQELEEVRRRTWSDLEER
jgi:predicted nucleic acid-binding protein